MGLLWVGANHGTRELMFIMGGRMYGNWPGVDQDAAIGVTMSVSPFVGAWQLLSLEARTSTGEVSYPFGKDAAGYLLYSREGYMSVSVMQARRAHFASPDALAAPAAERLAAFDTYSSYSGRYEVRGQKVIHHVEVSSFPNWSGKAQERFFAFSGDRLTLTAPPMRIGGVEQTLVAIWQRLPSVPV